MLESTSSTENESILKKRKPAPARFLLEVYLRTQLKKRFDLSSGALEMYSAIILIHIFLSLIGVNSCFFFF